VVPLTLELQFIHITGVERQSLQHSRAGGPRLVPMSHRRARVRAYAGLPKITLKHAIDAASG